MSAGVPTRAVAWLGTLTGRAVVAVVVLGWTLPTIGLVLTSVRPRVDAQTSGWWTALTHPGAVSPTLDHYRDALGRGPGPTGDLWSGLVASAAISVPATVAVVGLGALAAYGLAWTRVRGRDVVFLVVVALVVVPVQLTLVPLADAYADGVSVLGVRVVPAGGLAGSFAGLWLAHAAFGLPLTIYLLRHQMAAVPAPLVESARLDGAGHLAVFRRIVVPFTLPALAAVAVFQLLWIWNDYLVAVTLLGGADSDLAPLTVRLADLVFARGEEHQLLAAGAVITMAVPVAVFVGLRRWWVSAAGDLASVD